MALAVAVTAPPSAPALATTVMTPLLFDEPPTTYLVFEITQPESAVWASEDGAL